MKWPLVATSLTTTKGAVLVTNITSAIQMFIKGIFGKNRPMKLTTNVTAIIFVDQNLNLFRERQNGRTAVSFTFTERWQ